MDKELLRQAWAELGRIGGQARAKALTARQRRAIATKAARAASKARSAKARAAKQKHA